MPENQREQGAVFPVFKALEELGESNKRLVRGSGVENDRKSKTTIRRIETEFA